MALYLQEEEELRTKQRSKPPHRLSKDYCKVSFGRYGKDFAAYASGVIVFFSGGGSFSPIFREGPFMEDATLHFRLPTH